MKSLLQAPQIVLDAPIRLKAGYPTADTKLYFSAAQVKLGDGSSNSLPSIGTTVPLNSAGNVDFQTGVGTGISASFPSSTTGYYRRFVVETDGTTIYGVFSAEFAAYTLPNPGTIMTAGRLLIGWVDLQATSASAFKTAGSATSIVESAVSGVSRIFNVLGPAGSGSGSGGGSFDISTILTTFGDKKPPSLRSKRSTDQSITQSLMTDVLLDADTFETMPNGSLTRYDHATGKYTALYTGAHQLAGLFEMGAAASGIAQVYILRQDNTTQLIAQAINSAAGSAWLSFDDVLDLYAGEYFKLQVYHTHSAAIPLKTGSYMTVLGPQGQGGDIVVDGSGNLVTK